MNRLLAVRRSTTLHIALWVVPIVAVVWWASKQSAPEIPTTAAAIGWLVGAELLYVVATILRSERWQQILSASDVPARRRDSYALVVVGYAGNNVLPARGGELLRIFLLGARVPSSKRTILGTIVAERLLDAIALALILVVLAYGLLSEISLPGGAARLVILGGIALVLVVTGLLALRYRDRLSDAWLAVKPVLVPVRGLLSARGAALLALTLLIWAFEGSVYWCVAEALHVHLGIIGALSVMAFTNVTALVPAAPGYIGTYDAAVLFAVKAVSNTSSSLALSYLLLLRFVLFVPITAAGFILLLVRYGGVGRIRAARRAQQATA